jgi:hypothetical protein
MFQFPEFAPIARYSDFIGVGCPIRKSTDQLLFAHPRSLSQLITSFFASESQGIPHTPFITSFNEFFYHHHTPFCVACVTCWDFSYVLAFLIVRVFLNLSTQVNTPTTSNKSVCLILSSRTHSLSKLLLLLFLQYVNELLR